ncbi:uncharacterized protein LOC132644150 [Lycium barbarum]|uniref:uncharacterized protein LOC132644150 n=1 Tax=Lycium barbarum TaxID=112863 RepID=UPI00293EF0A6|nr:uncharacterized protein LOC132644150 [Lycium barbarum]
MYYAQQSFTTTVPVYTALPSIRVSAPTYQTPPQQNYRPPPYNPPQNYQNQLPPPAYNAPRPAFERRPVREFTTLFEPKARLFEWLLAVGLIQKVPQKPAQLGNRFYKADQTCAYHSGGYGHSTKDCINLKHKIQDLIDKRKIILETVTPNVNTNSLPNHGNNRVHMIERNKDWEACRVLVLKAVESLEQIVASLILQEHPNFKVLIPALGPTKAILRFSTFIPAPVVAEATQQIALRPKEPIIVQAAMAQGMTRSGRCYTPEELAQNATWKENTQKRAMTEGEAEDFWQRMQPKNYSIVEHLKKTSAQISVLSLLASSPKHKQALMKVLDNAYVPAGTSSEDLVGLVAHIIREHKICFSKEDLPVKETSHNRALNITMECGGKAIRRVLMDNGSGLNIFPITTLTQLGYDMTKIL